ncbi:MULTISPECIES: hypothetical protein [Prochlorococcus]|uniref:hypothetical protein n=1 Tax=Prochlorococcus TaxID=1218 RepID=UPI001F4731C5|nr:hypothetical protein [Prochlorococcus marinus]
MTIASKAPWSSWSDVMQTKHQGVLERCATPVVMSAPIDQCCTTLEVKVERDDTPKCHR